MVLLTTSREEEKSGKVWKGRSETERETGRATGKTSKKKWCFVNIISPCVSSQRWVGKEEQVI